MELRVVMLTYIISPLRAGSTTVEPTYSAEKENLPHRHVLDDRVDNGGITHQGDCRIVQRRTIRHDVALLLEQHRAYDRYIAFLHQ